MQVSCTVGPYIIQRSIFEIVSSGLCETVCPQPVPGCQSPAPAPSLSIAPAPSPTSAILSPSLGSQVSFGDSCSKNVSSPRAKLFANSGAGTRNQRSCQEQRSLRMDSDKRSPPLCSTLCMTRKCLMSLSVFDCKDCNCQAGAKLWWMGDL